MQNQHFKTLQLRKKKQPIWSRRELLGGTFAVNMWKMQGNMNSERANHSISKHIFHIYEYDLFLDMKWKQ